MSSVRVLVRASPTLLSRSGVLNTGVSSQRSVSIRKTKIHLNPLKCIEDFDKHLSLQLVLHTLMADIWRTPEPEYFRLLCKQELCKTELESRLFTFVTMYHYPYKTLHVPSKFRCGCTMVSAIKTIIVK